MFPTAVETLGEVCSCGRELCWRQLGLKPRKPCLLHVLWSVRMLFEQTSYRGCYTIYYILYIYFWPTLYTSKLAPHVENQNKWAQVNIYHFYTTTYPDTPIYLSNVEIPPATTVKYLGLHLDNELNWKEYIMKKRKQMGLRHKELYWLHGRSSPRSVGNKLLLYKSLIAPIWTYGIELWGCASKSNTVIIQRCQCKILWATVDAPRYVTNAMIHEDLDIPNVQEVTHTRSIKHRIKLETRTRYSTPFHEMSYEDWNDGGQLTCNTVNEISSLEGTSSR